ncbi:hypothetical protein AHAS_Ahas19G0137100 [Arachis hypogaea]
MGVRELQWRMTSSSSKAEDPWKWNMAMVEMFSQAKTDYADEGTCLRRFIRQVLDGRSEEKGMQSGELMEKQGFGMHTSTCTRDRRARLKMRSLGDAKCCLTWALTLKMWLEIWSAIMEGGGSLGYVDIGGLRSEDILLMEFNMPEEARGFYNNYSRIKGFATRQGKKTDRKREHKVVTRCGCVAEMRINRKDGSGKWFVSRFIDEHSHELLLGKFVDFLRSHRKISEVEIAHLTSMRDIGISIPKIYESFAAQLGGFNMVSFTK